MFPAIRIPFFHIETLLLYRIDNISDYVVVDSENTCTFYIIYLKSALCLGASFDVWMHSLCEVKMEAVEKLTASHKIEKWCASETKETLPHSTQAINQHTPDTRKEGHETLQTR